MGQSSEPGTSCTPLVPPSCDVWRKRGGKEKRRKKEIFSTRKWEREIFDVSFKIGEEGTTVKNRMAVRRGTESVLLCYCIKKLKN